jgi:hypothetical protein
VSLAIGRRAFRCIVFEFHCGDNLTGLRIDRGKSADREDCLLN